MTATFSSGETPRGKTPPNIIWMIADDVSDVGCYGSPVRTPNLDRLAAEGVRFENAFAASPSCSPSRAAMLTGLYPHAVGMGDHNRPLPEHVTILPALLREGGYWSANIGKLHLGPNGHAQFDRSYEAFRAPWPPSSRPPVDEEGVTGPKRGGWDEFVSERPSDRPFFVSIGFTEGHRNIPERLEADEHAGFERDHVPRLYSSSEVEVPPFLPDVPEVRGELALYYDQITYLDGCVGEVLDWLEGEGMSEDTLVMFWSDQGMAFPRAKTSLYDSGIAVPLIARWPGVVPAGLVQGEQISLVDLTPTALAAAGLPAPADLQSESRLDMLTGVPEQGRQHVFAERNWHSIDDHIRCVRTDRFKYIRNYYPSEPFGHPGDIVRSDSYQAMLKLLDSGDLPKELMMVFRCPRPVEELYDLSVDPTEFRNVALDPEYQDELKLLRKALDGWIADTGDDSPEHRLVNQLTDWRQGYEGQQPPPPVRPGAP